MAKNCSDQLDKNFSHLNLLLIGQYLSLPRCCRDLAVHLSQQPVAGGEASEMAAHHCVNGARPSQLLQLHLKTLLNFLECVLPCLLSVPEHVQYAITKVQH